MLFKLRADRSPSWQRMIPGGPDSRPLPVTGVLSESVNIYQGKLWGLRHRPPQAGGALDFTSPAQLQLCTSSSGCEWEEVGSVFPAEARVGANRGDDPWILFPLGNGKFLGVFNNPQQQNDRESLFALFRRAEGTPTLRLDELCDMGLRPSGGPTATVSIRKWIGQGLFPLLSSEMRAMGYFRTDSYICLMHPSSGLLWVFRGADGALKGLYPLFDKVLGMLDQPENLETVILRAQPRPDGHLILASRSEEGAFKARGQYPKPWRQPVVTEAMLKDPVQFERVKRRVLGQTDPGFRAYPDLLWWDFDPGNGKFTRLDAPPGAPDKIWSAEDWLSLRFEHRINGDLAVTFPPFEPARTIPPGTPASADLPPKPSPRAPKLQDRPIEHQRP